MEKTKSVLKGYFLNGLRPDQEDFEDLIDSSPNKLDDAADINDITNETPGKFITSRVAKTAIEQLSPVQTVNNQAPDSGGDITVTNVTGTAGTITGNISKSQVTGLQADLDSKQNTLVSGTNIRTINGQSLLGSTDLAIVGNTSHKYQTDFLISSSSANQFFLGGSAITGGSITNVIYSESGTNHPGIVSLRKPANQVGGYYYTTNAMPLKMYAGLMCDFIFKVSPGTSKMLRIGLYDSTVATSPPANGVYFEITGGTSLTGTAKAAKNGVRTSSSGFSLLSGEWYHLRITLLNATSVKFDIYSDAGVSLFVETLITNVTDNPTSLIFIAYSPAAGTNQVEELCQIDYISIDLGNPQRGAL